MGVCDQVHVGKEGVDVMTPEEIARNKRLQNVQAVKQRIPDKGDIEGMIGYLHKISGRIPTENECLRFHMFLNTFAGKPTERECTEFLTLLGMVRKL
jgi:hypothetical protein